MKTNGTYMRPSLFFLVFRMRFLIFGWWVGKEKRSQISGNEHFKNTKGRKNLNIIRCNN